MLLDYARVSTDDQKLNRQMDALQQAGCAEIYLDRRKWSQSCKTWTEPSTGSSTGRQYWGLSSNRAETYAKTEIFASPP